MYADVNQLDSLYTVMKLKHHHYVKLFIEYSFRM